MELAGGRARDWPGGDATAWMRKFGRVGEVMLVDTDGANKEVRRRAPRNTQVVGAVQGSFKETIKSFTRLCTVF